jgi:hypothetical protein
MQDRDAGFMNVPLVESYMHKVPGVGTAGHLAQAYGALGPVCICQAQGIRYKHALPVMSACSQSFRVVRGTCKNGMVNGRTAYRCG